MHDIYCRLTRRFRFDLGRQRLLSDIDSHEIMILLVKGDIVARNFLTGEALPLPAYAARPSQISQINTTPDFDLFRAARGECTRTRWRIEMRGQHHRRFRIWSTKHFATRFTFHAARFATFRRLHIDTATYPRSRDGRAPLMLAGEIYWRNSGARRFRDAQTTPHAR